MGEPLLQQDQQERLRAQRTLSAETEISREREANHQGSGGQGGTGYGRSDREDLVREVQPMIITLGDGTSDATEALHTKPLDLLPTFYRIL